MTVVVVNHLTLDGVMQAPAAADEDTRDGFTHGGWSVPYGDQVMGEFMGNRMADGAGAMLFGRWTYESLRRAWTDRTDGNPFTDVLSKAQKYVASTTLEEPLPWMNSTLLNGDAADAVAELASRSDENLTILGSATLVQSLMARNLVDELVLMIHPLVLGLGTTTLRRPRHLRGLRADRLDTHGDRRADRHLPPTAVAEQDRTPPTVGAALFFPATRPPVLKAATMTRLDLRSTSQSERAVASTTIEAAPETVFSVLADPSTHASIDGTGWVRQPLDGDRITASGQVFRMAMHHENHPDKDYKIANRVETFDEPHAIAWKPGQESPDTGELSFGGWLWRCDLEATAPSSTTVTLTYDWSAVPPDIREYIQFPPFEQDHLDNSLQHLSNLAATLS